MLAPLATVAGVAWIAVARARRPRTTPFIDVVRHRAADVVWAYTTRFELRTKHGPRVTESVHVRLSDGASHSSHGLPPQMASALLKRFPNAKLGDTPANRAAFGAQTPT